MRKEKAELKVGMLLEDGAGIYQITGFNEKGNTLCTVRECVYNDDEDLDKFDLGEEMYLTREEVKNCLHHMTGRNVDPVVIAN